MTTSPLMELTIYQRFDDWSRIIRIVNYLQAGDTFIAVSSQGEKLELEFQMKEEGTLHIRLCGEDFDRIKILTFFERGTLSNLISSMIPLSPEGVL